MDSGVGPMRKPAWEADLTVPRGASSLAQTAKGRDDPASMQSLRSGLATATTDPPTKAVGRVVIRAGMLGGLWEARGEGMRHGGDTGSQAQGGESGKHQVFHRNSPSLVGRDVRL
jgi:hypothetical protein